MATTRPRTPEAAASDLFQAVVSALAKSTSANADETTRLFFPSGIGLIAVEVEIAGAKASIKIASDSKVATAPTSPKTHVLMAESCREAKLFTAGGGDLKVGDMVPATSEVAACGAIAKKIKRTDPEFGTLVSNTNAQIVFKDEEGTGADRIMTKRLSEKLDTLAASVAEEWSGTMLRVTEAWDENNEHAGNSLHYEGRAADLTTQPLDGTKLGRLARLAVDSGFDWVWFENAAHVHVSVTK